MPRVEKATFRPALPLSPAQEAPPCHSRLPPSLKYIGVCFGLFLQAQKGDKCFKELAEGVEHGNYERVKSKGVSAFDHPLVTHLLGVCYQEGHQLATKSSLVMLVPLLMLLT